MEPTTVKDGRNGYSTTSRHGVTLTIYMEPAYAADQPDVPVTIELFNGAEGTVLYYKINDFREFMIDVLDQSGQRAKLRPGLTTYEPSPFGFRVSARELAPGASEVFKVDLRKVFALEPGSYHLSAKMLVSFWSPKERQGNFGLPLEGIPLTVKAPPAGLE